MHVLCMHGFVWCICRSNLHQKQLSYNYQAHCDMAKMALKQSTLSDFLIHHPTVSLEPSTKIPRVDVQNEVEHHKLSCMSENEDQKLGRISQWTLRTIEDESDKESTEEESGSEIYHDSYCKRNCYLVIVWAISFSEYNY